MAGDGIAIDASKERAIEITHLSVGSPTKPANKGGSIKAQVTERRCRICQGRLWAQ